MTRDELVAALDAADRAVDDLCSGRLRWEMRVPAEPDHDPDLIISKALGLARAALASEPPGLDVERLARAEHDRPLESVSAGMTARCLGLRHGALSHEERHRIEAEAVAAAYLASETGEQP